MGGAHGGWGSLGSKLEPPQHPQIMNFKGWPLPACHALRKGVFESQQWETPASTENDTGHKAETTELGLYVAYKHDGTTSNNNTKGVCR